MFDAIVLAGGEGRRLGGVDKPSLLVGSVSMLDRVLLACAAAVVTVVVGPERPTVRPVQWTREDPVGGGPAAGLAAALALVTSEVTLLLAADLPHLTRGFVDLLSQVPDGSDGLVAAFDRRPQWLCGAWRTTALRAGVGDRDLAGLPLRAVLEPLRAPWVGNDLGSWPQPWDDVDTEADLARARERWT